MIDWTDLPPDPAPDLKQARQLLHWAVQLLAGAADASIPVAADDSHTNVFWDAGLRMLVGRPLGDGSGLRLGLAPRDLSVFAVGERDVAPEATPHAPVLRLADLTLTDAADRLGRALSQRLGRSVDIQFRDYDMPDHPVGNGQPFPSPPALALSELALWYGLGTAALESLAGDDERAVPVAIWPHHFDIGTILFLGGVPGSGDGDTPPTEAAAGARERAPQIGVGLSPGDGSRPDPYFYVTPWPVDSWENLPDLPHGRWQTEGFQGAVLGAAAVHSLPGPERQAAVDGFLQNAVTQGERLIRRSPD